MIHRRYRISILRSSRTRAIIAGAALGLAVIGSALAFEALPPGTQVNDDPAAGINKAVSVSGEDPANADVVGGSLTAGKVAVPWAVFRQQEAGGAHDQIFTRSFAGGTWTTRGSGTVGGRSSAGPQFSGSLNFDQGQDGEAPAIDFAGAGRTVPWATWFELMTGTGFANDNIMAALFDNQGDANQGKWLFAGQSRGNGGAGPFVPSLNIHTGAAAEYPSLAGGSTVDPTKPGPWVAWQETTSSPVSGMAQIFVEKSIGPGQTNCDGVTPAGVPDGTGHVPAIGGFCWQETGLPRVGPAAADASLNVDPTRVANQPQIVFAGSQDSVPWVVWYETGSPTPAGLSSKGLVFAAEGISDPTALGGIHWQAVGNQLSGTLDHVGAGFGTCAASVTNEGQCSLNADPGQNAEDPRVTAGAMSAGSPTVPWVVWDEQSGSATQIFVSRLVGTGATAHFEIVGANPISTGSGSSTRPDITFSGNTPYVSWREDVGGGVEKAFLGHFVNAVDPTFVLDESDVPLSPTAQADVREPISSSCTANPFESDGTACQGGAIGTPFFLYTSGSAPLGLFADAYQPGTPGTGAATAITTSGATVSGTVNPQGAVASVVFQYGTSTAYGQATAAQATGTSEAPESFTAQLGGLPAGTTIHYRLEATSDFGTSDGPDQTFTTATTTITPKPPKPKPVRLVRASVATAQVSRAVVSVRLACFGANAATCRLSLALMATASRKTVVVGSESVVVKRGGLTTAHVTLNATGRALLAEGHDLAVELVVKQVGFKTALSNQELTLHMPKPRR